MPGGGRMREHRPRHRRDIGRRRRRRRRRHRRRNRSLHEFRFASLQRSESGCSRRDVVVIPRRRQFVRRCSRRSFVRLHVFARAPTFVFLYFTRFYSLLIDRVIAGLSIFTAGVVE